jgi:dipeptidyl aminopeptidase/acylaminoacyl peptidase
VDLNERTALAMRLALGLLMLTALAAPTLAAGRPMTVDDLLAVKAVSDPQIAPDGKSVVYVVSEVDRESGKSNSSLWLVPIKGGGPRRLTTTPGTNNHPRWSPDGKSIAFVSSRGGSAQVWLLPIDGGEPRQLTKLPIDVAGPIWSPKGDRIAFAAEVYPGKTAEETAAKDKEKEASKSRARIFDRLMIRHWTSWDEGKRSHLFVCDATTGEARDLTPKLDVNTPPAPFGGSSDYAWSHDGKEVAFTAEPMKDEAWSTNTDIWTVPVTGGAPKNLTAENKGADAQPVYSPDGKAIAYVSQARAGFEADLWILKVRNLHDGFTAKVSEPLDRPVLSFVWTDTSRDLFAVIDDAGTESVVNIPYNEKNWRDGGITYPNRVVKGGVNTSIQVGPGVHDLVFLHGDTAHPGEIHHATFPEVADTSEKKALTHHNDALVSGLDVSKAEGFTFKGADGDDVSGWLIKPPGFDAKKTYPVVFLIHGGPQGAWHDEWHARWNFQMFASPGYAVVAVNPRGSTGYGQKFTDQISQDWTGRVYDDLMKGLDHALKTYSFLDRDRVAAAGGSYGGFMVNWIAGHTDRFKALISHAGVFDLTSKYGTTEELWFPEWEFGGTPWEKPEMYRKQSPSGFVENFKTPTLVTHGALDFRVPDAQGLGLFTALQRRGVPSRLVFFPDEGHWVLKPANRVVWWNEMLGWLKKYL